MESQEAKRAVANQEGKSGIENQEAKRAVENHKVKSGVENQEARRGVANQVVNWFVLVLQCRNPKLLDDPLVFVAFFTLLSVELLKA